MNTFKINETVEELQKNLILLKIKEKNMSEEFDEICSIDGIIDKEYLDNLDKNYHDCVDEIYIIEEKIKTIQRAKNQRGIDKNELYLVSNNID